MTRKATSARSIKELALVSEVIRKERSCLARTQNKHKAAGAASLANL
jgi:hypothetical protein